MAAVLPARARRGPRLALIAALLLCAVAPGPYLRTPAAGARSAPPHRLAPVRAVGIRLDTFSVGGYAHGTFTEAMQTLGGDLSSEERALVGRHLDRIFGAVLEECGLGRVGRLRLSYERSLRPDGSTRAIRVLAAEAAAAGRMHTAYYYERDGRPGYFDPAGRSLDPGAWTAPLVGARISSPYGPRRMHPVLQLLLPHTGIDYAAPPGTPVRAAGDGIISFAGPRGGYGNLVEIQHPSGYTTRYAHLSRISPAATRSRAVRQGEVVGEVGMSGLATGPHLHYEVRRHGIPIDPQHLAEGPRAAANADAETRWPAERLRLAALLARAPTMVRGR